MPMRFPSVFDPRNIHAMARYAGLILCLLGGFVLSGWLVGSETMVRMLPGSPGVVISSAFMFLITGICLLLGISEQGRASMAYRLLPMVLVSLSFAVLIQHVFDWDLGIDLAELHAKVGDGHGKPGRAAPNACIAFLFAGCVFMLTRKPVLRAGTYRLSLLLTGVIFLIGTAGFIGYMLNLDAMYQIASFNRMPALTAIGLSVAGIGTWALTATHKPYGLAASLADARQITGLAAGLLTVFALASGMTVFGMLKNSYERSAIERIGLSAKTSALSISSLLDKATLLSRSVSSRPSLSASLAALSQDDNDVEALDTLAEEGFRFLALDFSSVQVFDNQNKLRLNVGRPVETAQASADLNIDPNSNQSQLVWKGSFFLRNAHNLVHDGQIVGRITMERQMREFTDFIFEAQRISDTSDMLLCAREKDTASCFPSRHYDIRRLPMFSKSGEAQTPMAKALLGDGGAMVTRDGRGVMVLAGYVPVPGYELGLVEKVDSDELYAPLDRTLPYLFAAVIVFITIGTLLLRQWVMPLITRISSERLRMKGILNTSNDAFMVINADGIITDWNAEAERIFGWTAAEATGEYFAGLLIAPEQREQWENGVGRFIGSGTLPSKSRRMETVAVDRTGNMTPVEVSVSPFYDDDGYALSAFLRDLSSEKQAEKNLEEARAALLQSQKLEAIGKLTGGVAHDFNNVLQVIKGTLQLLEAENPGDDKVQKRADTAMTAVDRGAKLSAELLAFARRHPLQPRVTNLGSILRRMNDMLQRVLGESVEIETVVAGGLWNTYADQHQLEQVLLNLAINGRDAMNGEGKLTIEVGNATLDDDYVRQEPGLKPGQYVMIAISDTGCGMPADIAQRAFEPFFTTKPEGRGTGLGLSMAYGFAKQSGGHIRIYSEVDSGTTIRIYLPRSFEKEEEILVPTANALVGGNESILVVEDDATVQATVVELLSGLGYKVLKADNAEMALEVLKKGTKIDLLFTDVVMPGALRSPELAAQAKILLPDLKVLFTSGYTQNAIVHGGRLDPGVNLLSKPYSREQLARKVRELLTDAVSGATPAAGNTVRKPARNNFRIAFVEDHAEFRNLGSEMLSLLGHEVSGFRCAEEALEALEQGPFDVLLTDVRLPGMSGIELASRAAMLCPDLRIILASGRESSLQEAGSFAHQTLLKPFTVAQLQEVLQNACEPAE